MDRAREEISYLESTSWVKNNCKGQLTEYSREIASQPSTDTSDVVFKGATPDFPERDALDFCRSA